MSEDYTSRKRNSGNGILYVLLGFLIAAVLFTAAAISYKTLTDRKEKNQKPTASTNGTYEIPTSSEAESQTQQQ